MNSMFSVATNMNSTYFINRLINMFNSTELFDQLLKLNDRGICVFLKLQMNK